MYNSISILARATEMKLLVFVLLFTRAHCVVNSGDQDGHNEGNEGPAAPPAHSVVNNAVDDEAPTQADQDEAPAAPLLPFGDHEGTAAQPAHSVVNNAAPLTLHCSIPDAALDAAAVSQFGITQVAPHVWQHRSGTAHSPPQAEAADEAQSGPGRDGQAAGPRMPERATFNSRSNASATQHLEQSLHEESSDFAKDELVQRHALQQSQAQEQANDTAPMMGPHNPVGLSPCGWPMATNPSTAVPIVPVAGQWRHDSGSPMTPAHTVPHTVVLPVASGPAAPPAASSSSSSGQVHQSSALASSSSSSAPASSSSRPRNAAMPPMPPRKKQKLCRDAFGRFLQCAHCHGPGGEDRAGGQSGLGGEDEDRAGGQSGPGGEDRGEDHAGGEDHARGGEDHAGGKSKGKSGKNKPAVGQPGSACYPIGRAEVDAAGEVGAGGGVHAAGPAEVDAGPGEVHAGEVHAGEVHAGELFGEVPADSKNDRRKRARAKAAETNAKNAKIAAEHAEHAGGEVEVEHDGGEVHGGGNASAGPSNEHQDLIFLFIWQCRGVYCYTLSLCTLWHCGLSSLDSFTGASLHTSSARWGALGPWGASLYMGASLHNGVFSPHRGFSMPRAFHKAS